MMLGSHRPVRRMPSTYTPQSISVAERSRTGTTGAAVVRASRRAGRRCGVRRCGSMDTAGLLERAQGSAGCAPRGRIAGRAGSGRGQPRGPAGTGCGTRLVLQGRSLRTASPPRIRAGAGQVGRVGPEQARRPNVLAATKFGADTADERLSAAEVRPSG